MKIEFEMDSSRFIPIFPAHAIERCCATVAFDQTLPAKLFDRVKQDQDTLLRSLGFAKAAEPIGFAFDVATGRVIEAQPGAGPVAYSTFDQATTITILNNQVSLQNVRYVRWANFRAALEKHFMPVVTKFVNAVSIASVQLEYSDRFMWTGTWNDFKIVELINVDSELVARKAAMAPEQWHSHNGWFESLTQNLKRLVNVRVDVATARMPNALAAKPSVGIYTSLRDAVEQVPLQIAPAWISETDLLGMLDRQHFDLKNMLRAIITQAPASAIGL